MSQEIEDVVKLTPMMEQWHRCKREAKEAILLFRMGDFYEDAKLVADKLELTLTRRQGIPMAASLGTHATPILIAWSPRAIKS